MQYSDCLYIVCNRAQLRKASFGYVLEGASSWYANVRFGLPRENTMRIKFFYINETALELDKDSFYKFLLLL
jgi:hypothetical protein